MSTRSRKPNVSRQSIAEAIFNSEDGALTVRDLGVAGARLNGLVAEGFLTLRAGVQKVTDAEGSPQRGRPRKLYGLSKNVRAKMRRQAQAA